MVCNIITVIIPFVINLDNKENTSVFFAMDPDEKKKLLEFICRKKPYKLVPHAIQKCLEKCQAFLTNFDEMKRYQRVSNNSV